MSRSILAGWLAGSLALSAIGIAALPANAETEIVAVGTFEGRGGHTMSGGVTILSTDSGYVVVLDPDFFLDGAPDPKLGFGNDGYDASTRFSALEENTGLQAYALPEEIDPSSYNEFWVWCERFNAPLGVARID